MLLDALGWERRSTVDPRHPKDPALAALFDFGQQSAAGMSVTPDRALRSVAVFACVRVIAETMGQLPLIVYRREKDSGRHRDDAHRVARLLRERPNRWQTPSAFKEMMTAHCLLRGNAYAEIVATGQSAAAELVPLHPDRVEPFWAPDGRRAYAYQPADGPRRVLLQDEVLHIHGLSTDGLKGVGPIALARNAVGLDLAQEEFAGRQMQNGARPGGILKVPNALQPETAAKLKKQWEDANAGVTNAGKVAVLEGGVEWQAIGMNDRDAQFLEDRQFSVEQIARLFRVPPHKIGDLRRATFSNIEHQALEFVQDTVTPWAVRWEEAVEASLLTDAERRTHFVEVLLDALLRGDIASRQAFYASGRQWGYLSVNDIRAKENMNPVDGGDVYLQPQNMVPTGGVDGAIADLVKAELKKALAKAGGTGDGQ